jgi:hypothetical protein
MSMIAANMHSALDARPSDHQSITMARISINIYCLLELNEYRRC